MTLNLIDAFSYYLVLAFVTGTVLRDPQLPGDGRAGLQLRIPVAEVAGW